MTGWVIFNEVHLALIMTAIFSLGILLGLILLWSKKWKKSTWKELKKRLDELENDMKKLRDSNWEKK